MTTIARNIEGAYVHEPGHDRPHPRALYSEAGFIVERTDDLEALEDIWTAFEKTAIASPYQSHRWVCNWQRHIGAFQAMRPVVIVGRTLDGAVDFILPFALRPVRGALVLNWSGDQASNYGMGLFSRHACHAINAVVMSVLWRDILRLMPEAGAVSLLNMPEKWLGAPNPFRHLAHRTSPDQGYTLDLSNDFEVLFEKRRGGRTRARMRKNDARLLASGEIRFAPAQSPDQMNAIIAALCDQKNRQLAAMGITPIFTENVQFFFQAMAEPRGVQPPPFRAYGLWRGGKVLAAILGITDGRCFHGIAMSMQEGAARKYSPGSYALRKLIEVCCESGIPLLDFNLGRTDYKEDWADSKFPLIDIVRTLKPQGAFFTLSQARFLSLKRLIKNTPGLWSLFRKARKRLARRRRTYAGAMEKMNQPEDA